MARLDDQIVGILRRYTLEGISENRGSLRDALDIAGKALFRDRWTERELDADTTAASEPLAGGAAHQRHSKALRSLLAILRSGRVTVWRLTGPDFRDRVALDPSSWPDPGSWNPYRPKNEKVRFSISSSRVAVRKSAPRSAAESRVYDTSVWWAGVRADPAEVDLEALEKVCAELKRSTKNFGSDERRKGGQQAKYDLALQEAINRISDDLARDRERLTPKALRQWFAKMGARQRREQMVDSCRPFVFEPMIPDCDDLYMDEGGSLVWGYSVYGSFVPPVPRSECAKSSQSSGTAFRGLATYQSKSWADSTATNRWHHSPRHGGRASYATGGVRRSG